MMSGLAISPPPREPRFRTRPRPDDMGSCDATASGAERAYVRVTRSRQNLDLCIYHWRVHARALTGSGWTVDYHV